ncbi:glycosyltransferase [Sorangium sp. So ce1000]|uniref:glycosyltransferase n=1 Tax=Sorangium sp. So ce1000 TaxID=3133325 RepID=UPI003F5F326C
MSFDNSVHFYATEQHRAASDADAQSGPVLRRAAGPRRLLLVSYHFPPVGGAGVQRPVKFVKYLRRFGWETSVLVAANPSAPLSDESLLRDIPPETHIERARTWEPDYSIKAKLASDTMSTTTATGPRRRLASALRGAVTLALQPDPQVLWLPAALRAGSRLLRRVRHDAILATAPAYSNLVLGALLKKRFGLPLVLDFRDEWDISQRYLENARQDSFSYAIQSRLQHYILQQADALLGTTKSSARRLQDRAREAGGHAASTCIYNGFDEDDFAPGRVEDDIAKPERSTFRLVYTGTLWNLTSIEPLIAAIEVLEASAPEGLSRLELVIVGRRTEQQERLLDRVKKTRCHLRLEPYCDHSRSIAWMRSADALFMLLSDVENAHRVVPAKTFEYLSLGKAILAIAPDGEAADIIKEHNAGHHFQPGEVLGIAGWLHERLQGGWRTFPNDNAAKAKIARFSRERLCEQLARVLDQLPMAP